jgi:sigma-B regulation protein RsbU (phosphoserine phosphatase)
MALHEELNRFGRRISDFAGKFEEKTDVGERRSGHKKTVGNAFHQALHTLHDLFTRDVTREGLAEMMRRDSRDTFRYFTRDINFKEMQPLPWYERYPRIAWQIFTSLAFRLSPPRRIAFAIAIFAFLIVLVQVLSFSIEVEKFGGVTLRIGGTGVVWWLIAILILMFLLLLELRDKLDMKGDLTVAREIQYGLVPSKPWDQNGFHIHCRMRTANTVGGDYYDLIALEPGKIALLVGDVAGKGMPAALLMALLQGSVRTLLTAGDRLVPLMSKLNLYLSDITPENRLITLFYGELDTVGGELRYINAGHNPPLLCRKNGIQEWIPSTSLVLGVMKETPFIEASLRLEAGDHLLLYTDGVTEAFNEKEEEFGGQRLSEFLTRTADIPQDRMLDQLLREVMDFSHYVRPSDDITLMSVRRESTLPSR